MINPVATPPNNTPAGKVVRNQDPPAPSATPPVIIDKDLQAALDNIQKITTSGQKTHPYILWTLLQNVISLMQTVQQIGITQSNQLTILTKVQSICTDLMSSQKVYTVADFPIYPDHTDDKTMPTDVSSQQSALNTANQNASTFTQRLQALRDQAGNQAKSIQSGITSTDQSQQALSDFLQTFLQTIQSATQQLFS